MNIGEKIMKLRKQQGWSQEELANRLDVTRQSVSKWESGASVPELEKIVRLSELFGISTDCLLKENGEPATVQEVVPVEVPASEEQPRWLGAEEAMQFLELEKQAAPKIALGVLLCILSPVLLIVLSGAAEFLHIGMTEHAASGIGVAVLLALVAVAVTLFVTYCMKLEKFEYLEQESIRLEPDMMYSVRQQKDTYEPIFRRAVTVGVALCIVAVIPIVLAGAFQCSDMTVIWGVALLLCVISVAVFLFVKNGMVWESYQKLLEEGDYTRAKKQTAKKNSALAPIYWCTVTALYLGYSFMTSNWGTSWIIWPVAGVLYVAVEAIVNAVRK